MTKAYERIQAGYDYCRKITDFEPKVALILGSGLGNYAKNMKNIRSEASEEDSNGSRKRKDFFAGRGLCTGFRTKF